MSEEFKSDETQTTDPRPEWQFKQEFGIVTETKKAVSLTLQATELELDSLRRKLERLTYGG